MPSVIARCLGRSWCRRYAPTQSPRSPGWGACSTPLHHRTHSSLLSGAATTAPTVTAAAQPSAARAVDGRQGVVVAADDDTSAAPAPRSEPARRPPCLPLTDSGIGAAEYRSRRLALARRIVAAAAQRRPSAATAAAAAAPDRHVVVIAAAARSHMADGIPYVFRQNSDFRYLTGFRETDAVLVVEATAAGGGVDADAHATLFVKEQTADEALWEGARTSVERAAAAAATDDAQPLARLSAFLAERLGSGCGGSLGAGGGVKLWYAADKPTNVALHRTTMEPLLQTSIGEQQQRLRSESPAAHLHELRLIKSDSELALMAESARIASESFAQTMAFSLEHHSEPAIFAKIDYECRMRGADFLAYLPVVAGGHRSTTIHYIANEQPIDTAHALLLDAGCDYRGYVSDITRTWPVSGVFTAAQQAVYEAVLEVQQHCIGLCKVGNTLNSIHLTMMALIAKQLARLGVIKASASPRVRAAITEKICPHHVGHYLGLDVHDTPTISRSRPLQPSTVVTIEPGMYFQPNADYVPKEFRGLGVRIEDDIVVTADGPLVLTASCPKTLNEMNACLRQPSSR